MEKNWNYQKTEDECWLCTLKNLLCALDIPVTEMEIKCILQEERGLLSYSGRAFFLYLPVILDYLNIGCETVFDPENELLRPVLRRERQRTLSAEFLSGGRFEPAGQEIISRELLKERIRTCYDKKDALYYFYLSLQYVLDSECVRFHTAFQRIAEYLDRNFLVAACMSVSQLYGIDQNETLHSVLLIKEREHIQIIDPYEKLGLETEKRWREYVKFRDQLRWDFKVPYFIAVKQRGEE